MKKLLTKNKPEYTLFILLSIWWIINLIQAGFTELANDEAYYWMFAGDLDWGYFDHPPMTAFLVKLGSFLGGSLGVRFFFTLLQPLYLYIIYKIVKPAIVTAKDSVLFVVICAAMPILQLYGFLAVPDGPLLFFAALFLLSFKWLTEKNRWSDAILMGISMAALAYSKYHGALIVVFALLSYPRIFKNPKLYMAGVITIIAFMPHLLWQYNNDWVSFRYHLTGRNANFRLDYFTEYILNVVAIFNPLFFPLYVKRWIKVKSESPVQRAIYTIALGFILFFLASSIRGYVQPQWVIPSVFGAILLLWRYGIENAKVRKYTMTTGLITIGLVVIFRIVLIFNPLGIKFEIFDNNASYGAIADIAEDKLVIFDGSYAKAAKYQYYSGRRAYTQAAVSHRSSQWQFRDDDTEAAGETVLAEARRNMKADSVLMLANGKEFRYIIIDEFWPTRRVIIDFDQLDVPETISHGEKIELEITATNPYLHEISLSPDSIPIIAVLNLSTLTTTEIPVEFEQFTLAPGRQVIANITFSIPQDIKPGKYHYGFAIGTPYINYWFNSKTYNLKIKQ